MLNKIMGNKGMVKEICRDGEKIWEMPRCMLDVTNPSIGHTTIVGKTYPGKCEVIFELNDQEVNRVLSGPTGYFTGTLPRELKDGDYLVISASKSGWKKNRNTFFI